MSVSYETDVVAWANEQARLIRSGRFDLLDLEHIAEEIEDVGKSEQRELASRMAVLLAHLLKWQYQSERRGNSWARTIREQRKQIAFCLKKTPSLRSSLEDADWLAATWSEAVSRAVAETEIFAFPEDNPWPMDQVLHADFFPSDT